MVSLSLLSTKYVDKFHFLPLKMVLGKLEPKVYKRPSFGGKEQSGLRAYGRVSLRYGCVTASYPVC